MKPMNGNQEKSTNAETEALKIADKIANETFDSSDYNSNETAPRGLAETHEQVSDEFMRD